MNSLMKNYAKYALVFFFLLVLSLRLYIAFQTPYFSDDESYFNLRQIEEISHTGTPLYNDPLSYGGRIHIFPPLFHYILGFFNLFFPITFVGKFFPNLFASSLVIIVYFLSKEITKDNVAALYTAAISGFIPIFFQKTINSVTPYSLVVPLFAYSIYCFVKLSKDKRYAYPLIIAISSLTFIHASALLLVIALILYIIFLKIEEIREAPIEVEVVLFSSMLVVWFLLLIYRKSLLSEGLGIIWQNIPSQLIPQYFRNITVLEAIAKIGIIPFVYGIVTIYRYLFKKKIRFTYLFISFALTIGVLLIIKSIEFSIGLIFLGMILTILYSIYIKQFKKFLNKTKFAKLKPLLLASLSITLVLTQFIPSVVYSYEELSSAPSVEQVNALSWMAHNSDEGAKILSVVQDGHKIAYFAGRKNVMDSNFLGAGDTQKRYDDIIKIYNTQYKTQAIGLLNKYDIDYIYLSDHVRMEFGIDSLSYGNDEKCFRPVYQSGNITIYQSLCRLEVA